MYRQAGKENTTISAIFCYMCLLLGLIYDKNNVW